MKKRKQAYYDKYFEQNWNNTKSTWKGIKSLNSLKVVASSVSVVLSLDNGDSSNPYNIANTFNNYSASVPETAKISIKYINIFQTIFQMKMIVKYFCNLLITEK